jgi:hypothetical protein
MTLSRFEFTGAAMDARSFVTGMHQAGHPALAHLALRL